MATEEAFNAALAAMVQPQRTSGPG